MPSKTLFIASGLFALASAGSASVRNQCPYNVYLWVADSPAAPQMITIPSGGTHSEGYKTNPTGGGVSMKVAKVPDEYSGTPLTQFEYTLDSTLWYDLSVINGDPFFKEGQSLHSSNPGCQSIRCRPGKTCNSAYYEPDDNTATKACTTDSNTVLTVCLNGAGGDYDPQTQNNVGYSNGGGDAPGKKKKHHHKNKPVAPPPPPPVSVPAPVSYPPAPVSYPPAPVQTTFQTHVVTVTEYNKREAPTPQADAHLGARHAHDFHMHHRHGLSH